MEWDCLTDRDRFDDWYVAERDRFADAARNADWNDVFERLGKHPGWANLPRPGNRSGFAPLHQAARRGADFAVVSRLIAHGAWRTQRARDGRRPVDIARERGHTHLLQLLEPVQVRRLPGPEGALEHHFHALLRERTGTCLQETEHLLPPLTPLTEGPAVAMTFTVIGVMGGFTCRPDENSLRVHGHSRTDADDGDHYRVTATGWSRTERRPVPASSTTTIRPATARDAAVIARIHLDSRATTMPYLPAPRPGHEDVTRWIEDVVLKTCRAWVAVRGTEVVGYAALEGDMLEHLYLRPDVRRRGIGTLLLDEVRRHSPHALSLYVFQRNTGARAFYERHGFRVLDTSDGSRNTENLPDMTLRWTASPDPAP